MRQQVGRIYLATGYVVEQTGNILLGMLLAHLQGKAPVHGGSHGKLVNEAPIYAHNGNGTAFGASHNRYSEEQPYLGWPYRPPWFAP